MKLLPLQVYREGDRRQLPDDTRIAAAYAIAAYKRARTDRGAPVLQKTAETATNDPYLFAYLGDCYMRLGMVVEGRAAYEEGLRRDAECPALGGTAGRAEALDAPMKAHSDSSRRRSGADPRAARCGFVGAALLFSLWASPDRLASLPWFLVGMVGVLLVLLVTGPFLVALRRRVTAGHWCGSSLPSDTRRFVVTFFATRWPVYKLSWLNAVYAAIPSIRSAPWGWTQSGLQPNQTGGMMALCTAFAVAVTVAQGIPRALSLAGALSLAAGFVACS